MKRLLTTLKCKNLAIICPKTPIELTCIKQVPYNIEAVVSTQCALCIQRYGSSNACSACTRNTCSYHFCDLQENIILYLKLN